jgi:glucose-1-phosphate adenylyltransferase
VSETAAFILAGGVGKRLSLLTRYRAKPAVPFAGRYRIIDFTLTNCVHSGIGEVYVFTQYIARSLVRHLGIGKPWDLDRMTGGLRVLHPHLGYQAADWYQGTADALYQNLQTIRRIDCERVLILSADHVYRMDYRAFLDFHRSAGKPASVGVVPVPRSLTSEFGIATVDGDGRIAKFEEKPAQTASNLASMGIYVFDKHFLLSTLRGLKAAHDDLDFGKHVIPHLVGSGQISAYQFPGYWLDIGTVRSYYTASLELLGEKPRLKLHSWMSPVLTVPDDSPPCVVTDEARVTNSLICNGCVVRGTVRSSILSPGVKVERGARVENSIVFHDCVIQQGAELQRTILDKGVVVGPRASVGFGDPSVPNQLQPAYLNFGVTLVGKRTVIPGGVSIGTNCLVSGTLERGLVPKVDVKDGGFSIEGDLHLAR